MLRLAPFPLLLAAACTAAVRPGATATVATIHDHADAVDTPSPPLHDDAARHVHGEPSVLPIGITSFGATRVGDQVIVLGGYRGEPHHYDAAHQSDVWLALRRDAPGSPWVARAGVGRIQSAPLVQVGELAIATGGLRAHNPVGDAPELESLAQVMQLDPRGDRWTELPSLPEPRSSHDAVVAEGELWLVGGWRIDRDGRSAWHTTAIHRRADDPQAPWQSVAVPIRRRAHALVAVPGHLVVVGGMAPDGPTTQVDVLALADGTWSRAPDFPGAGFGVAAVRRDDAVVASGADGVVWSWTPGEPRWRALGRLAFPRFFHRMVLEPDGALLVVGGIAGSGSGQKVIATERFVPGRAHHLVQLRLDAPGHAKNRQGLLLHDDRLLVVGGNDGLEQHDFAPERFVDETWELELGTLAWHARAPLPVRRQSLLTLTTAAGTGLALGGFGHDGEVARTWSDGYAYDFDRNVWRALGEVMTGPRSQAGLVTHDGALFVLGGLDYDPRRGEADAFRHPREVLRSSLPELALRDAGLRLPRRRRAFGGALLGDRYVMIGGLAEGFRTVDVCESIAIPTGEVRRIACPQHARISPELVAIDGRLLLGGGTHDGAPDASLELYDPDRDQWRTLDVALPLPIPHLRLLPWGERVLAFTAHDPEPVVHLAVLTLPPRTEPTP
jgi:N-acetylneuraminic acid mutarotase